MTITGGAAKKRSTRSKAKAKKPTKRKVKAKKPVKRKTTKKPVTVEQLRKKAKRLGITLSKNGVAKKKAALQRAISAKR